MTWPTVAAGWRRSLGSMSEAISYDIMTVEPTSSKIRDCNITLTLVNLVVTKSAIILSMSSKGLGYTDNTIRSAVGGTLQRFSEWTSTTSIKSLPIFGFMSTLRFVLTVGNRNASASETVTYDHTQIKWYLSLASEDPTCPEEYCNKGNMTIDVIGRISDFDISSKIRLGHTLCEKTIWNSYSNIVCHVAEGLAFVTTLVATSGTSPGSLSTWFTYYRIITSMEAPNSKDNGGLSLTLNGQGFGEAVYMPRIRLAESSCDTRLTIHGLAFQLEVPTPKKVIGLYQCEMTTWISDTESYMCGKLRSWSWKESGCYGDT